MYKVSLTRRKGIESLPRSMVDGIMKRIMLVFPLAWNRLYKHLHFGPDAAQRYNYAPRSGERKDALPAKGSYTHKKLRLYGHTNPLQFTGRGMREALTTNAASVVKRRGGAYRSRATLPRVFNLRNPAGVTNPSKEITTVLRAEMAVLNRLADDKARAEFRRHSGFRG